MDSALVFLLGLVPTYVSIALVERYYTNYWTAFWNIYGLLVMCVATLFETTNVSGALFISGVAVLLVAVLYAGTQYDADITRAVGSSIITSSLGWFLYVTYRAHSVVLGALALCGNLFFTVLIMVYGISWD